MLSRVMLAILAGDLTAAEAERRHGVQHRRRRSGATGLSSPARPGWRAGCRPGRCGQRPDDRVPVTGPGPTTGRDKGQPRIGQRARRAHPRDSLTGLDALRAAAQMPVLSFMPPAAIPNATTDDWSACVTWTRPRGRLRHRGSAPSGTGATGNRGRRCADGYSRPADRTEPGLSGRPDQMGSRGADFCRVQEATCFSKALRTLSSRGSTSVACPTRVTEATLSPAWLRSTLAKAICDP
jgi:hypothetical protein